MPYAKRGTNSWVLMMRWRGVLWCCCNGGVGTEAYLRELWCASARKDALSCSHCPSRSLPPGPSGCWCRCTAAGSPSCQSLWVRWCSWCPSRREAHSTYADGDRTKRQFHITQSIRQEFSDITCYYWKSKYVCMCNIWDIIYQKSQTQPVINQILSTLSHSSAS